MKSKVKDYARNVIGRASATTLGWIAGGTRGAYLANKHYKILPNNYKMGRSGTSTVRGSSGVHKRRYSGSNFGSRSSHRSQSLSGGTRSRRGSDVSMYSRRSSLMSSAGGRSSVVKAQANNVVAGPSRKRGRKVHKEGRKKGVKVPRLLRKQVKSILEKQDYIGWYKEIITNQVQKPIDNLQSVFHACLRTCDAIPGIFFDPVSVRNAASILWNKFVPVNQNNVGTTAGQFQMDTLQIKVLEQNVIHRMKNNTARNMTLKIWDWSPKTTLQFQGFDPIPYLTAELLRLSPSGAPGSITEVSNYNVLGVTVGTIGFNPKMVPAFNQYYSLDETIVNLEPGKEYNHKLSGPNHKMYDYKKFFMNGAAQICNSQKFIKGTMVCMILDLDTTTLQTTGRTTDIVAADPFGLLLETTCFYKIAMPEQAGFIVPDAATGFTAGQSKSLGNRKSAFAIKNWASAQAGIITSIEDENPQAPTTVGV